MSAADNLLTNYDKVAYSSYFNTDMVIGVHSGSLSLSAPTLSNSPTTATDSYVTTFGAVCYFQGIFSSDNGTTWNDFGSYTPNLTTAGQPVLQTVTCRGYVSPTGTFVAVGLNWYDLVHSSGTAKTVLYKVAFFATPTQGNITPTGTNEEIAYSSLYNSRKIYRGTSFPVSTTQSTSISHPLGYVPKVTSFFVPTNSTSGNEGIVTVPAGSMMTLDWFSTDVQVSTTGVTFTTVKDAASGAIAGMQHYIIYLDG